MSGTRPFRVALVAASPRIVGGHSVQAGLLAARLRDDGVVVDAIDIDRRLPRPLRRVRGLRTLVNEGLYLAALRRVAGADVLHAFSASYWSFLLAPVPAMIAGRAAGCRVVLHYHSGELADHLETWGWRVRPWLALADDIVVCSEFQRAIFARYGYESRVIPNVVDLARFRCRERLTLAPRFVCTRNLERHYGVDVVLDAFAHIQQHHPDATLTVAGSGSQEASLKALAARFGIRHVEFVGTVDPSAMPALLDRADVFLNASRIDNQPVSIIEALSSGLPIVSTGVGGIGELVVENLTGSIVPNDDPHAMADAACALLDHPARALAMAREGRERAQRFTWASVREQWADVYRLREASAVRDRVTLPTSVPGAGA
jgi:glycosyltransferase involved in cell wall biosynthesis